MLGLGCAGLLLLSAAGAAAFYFFVVKPAQDVKNAITELGANVSITDGGVVVQGPGGLTANVTDGGVVVQGPGGLSANVTDAGVVVQTPGGPAVPLNSLGLAAGGPVCEQASTCCTNAVKKTGGSASALDACNNLKTLPTIACQQALETYKRSAPALGVACP
ncbi:MAG TPA: hypothetical protein VGK73_27850 [Polyangiaceae bacterium]